MAQSGGGRSDRDDDDDDKGEDTGDGERDSRAIDKQMRDELSQRISQLYGRGEPPKAQPARDGVGDGGGGGGGGTEEEKAARRRLSAQRNTAPELDTVLSAVTAARRSRRQALYVVASIALLSVASGALFTFLYRIGAVHSRGNSGSDSRAPPLSYGGGAYTNPYEVNGRDARHPSAPSEAPP